MEPAGGLILGIESSCDETAAAVVRAGSEALSNVVASQMSLHANYGGVVPELASREHLRNIVPVVREAMARAGITFADLDAVAVTEGPGLAGALLVGITYAKALSFGLGKPLISVNHLEGHIHAVLMEARERSEAPMEFPLLALVVSGGHTHLYLAKQQTRNSESDLELPQRRPHGRRCRRRGLRQGRQAAWPGLSRRPMDRRPRSPRQSARRAVYLRPDQTRVHRDGTAPANKKAPPRTEGPHFDFSFSGIKTAVLRYVETHHMRESIEARRAALAADPASPQIGCRKLKLCDQQTLDLIASFQYAVVGNLLRQTFAAAEALGAHSIVVSGGVAANSELRRRFQAEADRRGLPIAFPSLALSTDNAAMIAAAAWPKFLARDFAAEDLGATPQLRLGQQ